MFGYWPWIGLISVCVLITTVLIIKYGDRLCQARLTTIDLTATKSPAQPDDFELMEDGAGTMMDYNLQEGSDIASGAHYSPQSVSRESRRTMDTESSMRREVAL